MANTVSNISYANTFGDWVVATDALIRENNTLAKGNYTKDSGTLTLSESTSKSLSALGDVEIQKQLLVQGVASSATIDNNLTVGKQIYFTNAVLGLTHTGQANMDGLIVAQGPNIGITVANNAYVGGNTTIKYNTVTDKLQANTSVTTPLVSSDTVTNSGTVYTNRLQANSLVTSVTINNTGRVYTDTVSSNTSVTTPLVSSDTVNNSGTVTTNVLLATSNVNTSLVKSNTINNTGTVYTNVLTANSNVNTSLVSTTTLNNTGTVYTNVLTANTNVISPLVSSTTVNNTGTVRSDIVSANTNLTSPLVSSTTVNNTGTVRSDIVSANTNLTSPLVSSTTVNNTGTVRSDVLSANTNITSPLVSSTTVNNTGTIRTDILSANTSLSVPTLSLTTKIDGNNATGFLNSLYAQNMTISGNFVQTGSTIYASNTFILSQNVASAIDSYYNVDRGPGQNPASFRWTESPKNWQVKNVTSGTYYRVLTDEYFSTSLSDTSSSNVASASLANTLNNLGITATVIGQSAYGQANSAITLGQSAYSQANTATTIGQAAYVQANTALTTALAAKTTFTGTTGSPFTSNTLTFSSNNGITIVPVGSNTVAISTSQNLQVAASPTFATLTLSTTPLGTSSGGSGQTSASGAFNTFISAAAGTGSSGQVLTTGGAGSYYWAAGGGGGAGTTPGTTISSTRLSYSGDNANTIFTTPVFNQTNQLRAYINGVRQFDSQYTANSTANTITFSTPPSIGDAVLIEVDGYILNPYYANNIPVSPTGTITGNTIQLAINSLESGKAALSGATFTGDVTGILHDANTSNTSFATTQFVKNVLNQTTAVSGATYAISTSGNAGTVTNGVYTSGNQTIGGTKTFSSTISGSIDGNANTVTNGVYTSGNQTIGGTKTFSSTIVGSITGNANTVTTNANLTGDVTSVGNATTLAITGTNTGSFGSGTTVPQITVDAKGRITSITSTLITGGSAGVGATTFNRSTYTATAGQTSFSATYTVGLVQVYLNGIMLPSNDYTASSGTAIVLTNGCRAGDIVEIFAYTTALINNLSPGTTGGSAGVILYQSSANTTSNTSVGTAGYLLTSQGVGQPTWTNPGSLSVNFANTATSATSFTSTSQNSQFNSIGVNTAADSANTGSIRATGTITAGYSDDQLKTKLGNIDNALDKLMTLNGFYYEPSQLALDLGYTPSKQVGVSAQEVQKVLPEVVVPAPVDDKYLTVHYDRMVPLLIEAIKELKTEVEVLRGQIK